MRLALNLDPLPINAQQIRLGEYLRSALERIGIRANLRNQDFAGFIKRIYSDRDFDIDTSGGQMGPDPAIGTQRFYWSKNFQKGVAFSNGSHYSSASADGALSAPSRNWIPPNAARSMPSSNASPRPICRASPSWCNCR